VALATSDQFVDRKMALVTRALVLTGVVGPIAAAIAGWFIGGIAVAPFERLRRLASGLRPESVGRSLEFDSSNSEVSRLTEELDRARQRMMEGFASQERFLSNVSHEIKTPISVMLLEAQTLDTDGAPEHVRDFVESVGEEMHRLGKLVESFLTLTRVRDGKGIARIMRCGVNDLVMDSAEHCTPMARQHRVTLSPGLLASEETMDASIAGEPELLRTMLDNLVRNAIRFSPVDDRVEIRASVADGSASIVVRDHGPGIPESLLTTIFDRFAQAGDEQRKGRGHGLGLAIAQGIAELHGGRISVENCEDRGCSFEIVLPLYGG
jgi:signal transduction histidine kinase